MAPNEVADSPEEVEAPLVSTEKVKLTEEVVRLEGDVVPTVHRPGRGRGRGQGQGQGRGMSEKAMGLRSALERYERPGLAEAKRIEGGDVPAFTARKMNVQLRRQEFDDRVAVFRLAKGELLQTEQAGYIDAEEGEKTTALTQAEIQSAVPVGVAKKRFALELPYGPYCLEFTRNGQHLLAGGRKGHIAFIHCESMQCKAEIQLKETVRAVQPLHSQSMFAVAQKKYVNMYDNQGVELHRLKEHRWPLQMQFLPYHFLLVTATESPAQLHYRDISTGQEVCTLKTPYSECRSMRQNPRNAVIHVGHSNGNVTLWTPNIKEPVVKMQAHKGHVTALAVHGDYMVTSGADGLWKVWDLRKYDVVANHKSFGHAVIDLDISMTGLLALGFGSHVRVWKDVFTLGGQEKKKPYLSEEYCGKTLSSLRFRPYEDILGVGHSDGFESIIVPGAGFANFDTFEANPFETKQQRREKEIKGLLEKLQPDSIILDPENIGGFDRVQTKKDLEETAKAKEAAEAEAHKKKIKKVRRKKKMRGKGKIGKRVKAMEREKGKNSRKRLKKRIDEEGTAQGEDEDDEDSEEEDSGEDEEAAAQEAAQAEEVKPVQGPDLPGGALGRFYGKRRRKT